MDSDAIERLNSHYSSEIVCIAQFYGQCQQSQNARVCGLDENELTIEWETSNEDGTRTQSTSFAMTKTTSVISQVLDIAENARIALSAMSTANQQSGDMLPTPIEFLLPPQPIMVSVLGGLTALLFLALGYPNSLAGLVYWLLPQRAFQLVFYVLVGVHFVEAVVMYLACRYVGRLKKEYELSTSTQIQYTLSTLVFGLFAGIMFTRQVMKPPGYIREKEE
ncbi:hypothetical protein GGI17_001279 [Coemansia sp. S146]|nr:hypothetical protein GGI17_001279 [Coemansia sp. S146]